VPFPASQRLAAHRGSKTLGILGSIPASQRLAAHQRSETEDGLSATSGKSETCRAPEVIDPLRGGVEAVRASRATKSLLGSFETSVASVD
jgi:hypothetical protein